MGLIDKINQENLSKNNNQISLDYCKNEIKNNSRFKNKITEIERLISLNTINASKEAETLLTKEYLVSYPKFPTYVVPFSIKGKEVSYNLINHIKLENNLNIINPKIIELHRLYKELDLNPKENTSLISGSIRVNSVGTTYNSSNLNKLAILSTGLIVLTFILMFWWGFSWEGFGKFSMDFTAIPARFMYFISALLFSLIYVIQYVVENNRKKKVTEIIKREKEINILMPTTVTVAQLTKN